MHPVQIAVVLLPAAPAAEGKGLEMLEAGQGWCAASVGGLLAGCKERGHPNKAGAVQH